MCVGKVKYKSEVGSEHDREWVGRFWIVENGDLEFLKSVRILEIVPPESSTS
jgi:hypothetical protein